MRDFLPAEKARREHALGIIRASYAAHGFDEIETPVMEDVARLHSGLGGDNEKLSYSVLRRGLGRSELAEAAASADAAALADLGLRFDLTVPLARFYASNRGHLPAVFRAIQIAPVWRAERPQKGRFRQFVQCDIDIIGEPGPLAEVELVTATLATLDALGLEGCTIRIGDRRLLFGMLDALGFAADERETVLVTLDKLDKVGVSGVVAELRERGASGFAVERLEGFLARHDGDAAIPCRRAAIVSALPDGADDPVAVDSLEAIAAAVAAARPGGGEVLSFDPFLVRGMGYYTGTIFEIHHPDVPYSLGGGGRYDGMIGRFLGTDVPACGFSLGFERIVDLLDRDGSPHGDGVVLVHDADVDAARLIALKTELLRDGTRVRLERRTKNLRALLDRAREAGYTRFATVTQTTASAAELELRPISAD